MEKKVESYIMTNFVPFVDCTIVDEKDNREKLLTDIQSFDILEHFKNQTL